MELPINTLLLGLNMLKLWLEYLGVAQLVARSVRDAEVVGSSPITQTILKKYIYENTH